MDYKLSSEKILSLVGSKNNVKNLTYCATRLRFSLKDDAQLDIEALKKVEGVLAVKHAPGGQTQIVVGQDVARYYNELENLVDSSAIGGSIDVVETEDFRRKLSFSGLLDTISGIFTPILPAIVGGALIKTLLVILTTWFSFDKASSTYIFFNFIGDVPFYFLPILVAFSSSQKFKLNPMIGVTLALMLIHPTYTAMVAAKEPISFLGLPVTLATYTATVIPVMLIVWVASFVDRYVDKFTPKAVRFFLKPLITLLIMAPVAFVAVGPLGTIAGNALGAILSSIQTSAPWALPIFFGVMAPIVIMFGMHYVVTIPLVIAALQTTGFDTIGPGFLVANLAQTGSCLAVAWLATNQDFKALATSSGITALIGGVTEPAMYGVNLKLKKPFYAAMTGGLVGGLIAGLMGVKRITFGPTGIMTLPIFVDPNNGSNFIFAIIAMVVAFIVAFALTYYFVKTDKKIQEQI